MRTTEGEFTQSRDMRIVGETYSQSHTVAQHR